MVMISKQDHSFVLSPSDLTGSAACEFAWMRGVDVKLGRIERVDVTEDAMLTPKCDEPLSAPEKQWMKILLKHKVVFSTL